MSDNLLKLIPSDEKFVPDEKAQREARELLMHLVPEAEAVYVEKTPEVRFIDPGSNLDSIHCPICGARVDETWWKRAMASAYQTGFTDLGVDMPCCEVQTSLDQLTYDWPAGFARFALIARNPNSDIDTDKLKRIEEILGCKLKKIWAHY